MGKEDLDDFRESDCNGYIFQRPSVPPGFLTVFTKAFKEGTVNAETYVHHDYNHMVGSSDKIAEKQKVSPNSCS